MPRSSTSTSATLERNRAPRKNDGGVQIRKLNADEAAQVFGRHRENRSADERAESVRTWKRAIAELKAREGAQEGEVLVLTPERPLSRVTFKSEVKRALFELGFTGRARWVFVGEASMAVQLPKRRRGRVARVE